MTAYHPRSLEPVLRRAAREFPVVVLTGPRQAGKTTLLRRVFGDRYGYVSLDLPDVWAAAAADPRGFVDLHPPPVIYDEVQAVPDVLPHVRARVDEHRDAPGQFLLTGSQDLLLMERVTESLAGRAATLRLLSLSLRELAGDPHRPLPWEHPPAAPTRPADWWSVVLRGGYPDPALDPDRDAALWHASYVRTYLERDVRSLRQVGDLTLFQAFLRALAARSAQLLNASDVARDLGVAVNTVRAWIGVLEATHQLVLLRPWFDNLGKRLVKSPKPYFTDTGTLCWLVGLRGPEHAMHGPMAGAIVETAVVNEVRRALLHRGEEPSLWFLRTSDGLEVDLLVDRGDRLVPLEAKSTATPRPEMASGIRKLRQLLGPGRVGPGYVVHLGDAVLPLGEGDVALPLGAL